MLRRLLPIIPILGACAIAVSSSPASASTKPKVTVPAEEKTTSRGIVQQLLREGRIIRSSSVKRGMRGVGRSVFQGTRIEEFPIEVLGVLSRVQGGGDIVLIKVLGGTVVKRQSGIIAGMSGSPVYINGKLLGAIAMGWGFPKEPIGGVTPITDMIETSLPDATRRRIAPAANIQTPKPLQSTFIPQTPLRVGNRNIARVVVSRDRNRLAMSGDAEASTMTLRPASTILQVSGFSQSSMPRLRQMFEPYQIEPMMGPSSRKTGVKPSFKPGSAIGVQLVSGDMDQTAVGTITFRWGKRILAFGHPMFGQGAASLPMASAFVHEIFPSYQRSFKLASPVDVMGALQQDTQFAIGGTIGMTADTIPMTVTLRDKSREIAKTYHVRVMKDPSLTPQLIGSVAVEAIETTLGLTSDKMVRIGLNMRIDGAKPIVRRNLLYSNQAVTGAALADLGQSLSITQLNEFGRGSINRVDLDVTIEPVRKTAIIKSITADRNKIKAGETVSVRVDLEPSDTPGKFVTRTFQFAVPDDAPSGVMRIAASSSGNYWPLQMRVGGAPPDPTNLKQLIEAWGEVGAQNELMVAASTPRQYLQVEQKRVSNPPPSFARLMRAAPASNIGAFNEVELRRDMSEFSLSGVQFLNIPVESKRHPEKPAAAPTTGDTPTPATPVTGQPITITDSPQAPTPGDNNSTQSPLNMPWSEPFAAFTSPARFSTRDQSTWERLFERAPFLEWLNTVRYQTNPIDPTPKAPPGRQKPDRPIIPAGAPTPTPTPGAPAEATPTPTPTPTPDSKSLARPAQSWVQGNTADFLGGEFERAQVSSDGLIRVAPASKPIATTTEPFVWSIAGDGKGNTFLGLSNPARVRRVASDGTQSTVLETTDVAITALTSDAAGNVYAGLTPAGDVVRIAPDGTRTSILDTNQAYVGALEWDESGRLLIGTGGEAGQLYRLEAPAARTSAVAAPFAVLPQKHIRAISSRGENVYVGTGDEGVLYQLDNSGHAIALFQAGERDAKNQAETEILAVAAAPEGVYFGTSNSGTLYRWSAKNGVEALYPSPQQSIFAMRRTSNGKIYAGTGDKGVVYQIQPGQNGNDTRVARILEPAPTQALSLSLSPSGDLLVGTGNNGNAYRIALGNKEGGTYTSTVFDAKNIVQWGALRVVGENAILETRSGNTLDPDTAWSSWKPATSNALGEQQISSPAARYLQYRVQLPAQNPTAQLSRVEVLYRARNSAPSIALATPRGGEFWNGKQKLNWNAKDPDNDALRYRLWLSSDDGQTWKSVALEDATADSFELDTTKFKDGLYRAKIEATDASRNPDDPQNDSVISLPFTIDNTAPKFELQTVSGSADGPKLQAVIVDDLSPIAGAVWRVAKPAAAKPEVTKSDAKPAAPGTPKPAIVAAPADAKVVDAIKPDAKSDAKDDDWQAVSAVDGIFDSRREAILALVGVAADVQGTKATPQSTLVPRRIEVRAQDAAGNSTTITLPAK